MMTQNRDQSFERPSVLSKRQRMREQRSIVHSKAILEFRKTKSEKSVKMPSRRIFFRRRYAKTNAMFFPNAINERNQSVIKNIEKISRCCVATNRALENQFDEGLRKWSKCPGNTQEIDHHPHRFGGRWPPTNPLNVRLGK